jgi:hypothetical protein
MPRGRYRITNPTLAMKTNDNHGNTALVVPTGAFITRVRCACSWH